jgi:hypothetical protein
LTGTDGELDGAVAAGGPAGDEDLSGLERECIQDIRIGSCMRDWTTKHPGTHMIAASAEELLKGQV